MKMAEQPGSALASDLILHGGNFITLSPSQPRAQAVAISRGVFLAVGSDAEIIPLVDEKTRTLDLQGLTVVPGFNDAHCHPTNFAGGFLDLSSAASIQEIQHHIAAALPGVAPDGWLVGGGWHEGKLAEGRAPTRWDIDQVAPRTPVVLFRMGYHSLLANTEAMIRSKLDKASEPAASGKVERRETDNEPTGVFVEPGAMDLVWDHIPPPPIGDRCLEMGEELTRLAGLGLTSLTSSKLRVHEMRAYQLLYEGYEGPLPRLNMEPWAHWRGSVAALEDFIRSQCVRSPFGRSDIRLGALKLFVDGEESAGTALLYTDGPGTETTGLLMTSECDLKAVVLAAQQEGWDVAMHAIGDAAVDLALDAIEEAVAKEPGEEPRHAIIHACFCTPRAMERMARLGVIAVVQPNFVWLEGDELGTHVGAQRVNDYIPLRSMIDAGVHVAFSSDNLPYGPLVGIGSAVSRRTPSGRVINEGQGLTIEAALRCYTIEGAYRTHEEGNKGVIQPGHLADMAVLSCDPATANPDAIAEIEVLHVYVGGERVC